MKLYIHESQPEIHKNTIFYLLSQKFNKNIFKEHYNSIKNISKEWESVYSDTIKNKLNSYPVKNIDEVINNLYHNIELLFYCPLNDHDVNFINILGKSKYKKIIYIDDIHTHKWNKNDFSLVNNFDLILSTYAYKISELQPIIDISKVRWFPHYMADHMLINLKDKITDKILLTGNGYSDDKLKDIYPVRYKISKIADNFFFKILPIKEYHKTVGHIYYQTINMYIASITTPSILGYIVNKYLEIPGSYTLLLANTTGIEEYLKLMGFIDGYNFISFEMNTLIDKIKYIISTINRKKIMEIIHNGNMLIKSRHLLTHRIVKLNKISNQLLNKL